MTQTAYRDHRPIEWSPPWLSFRPLITGLRGYRQRESLHREPPWALLLTHSPRFALGEAFNDLQPAWSFWGEPGRSRTSLLRLRSFPGLFLPGLFSVLYARDELSAHSYCSISEMNEVDFILQNYRPFLGFLRDFPALFKEIATACF